MAILHKQRWEQIQKFQIDKSSSSFKFSDRLAAENMWTKEYALRVIEEYKAFMYLCSIGKNRTPSVAVDQCWHLHLLYTENYWDKFMPILGRNIHHGPTEGGVIEESRYMSQYSETLKAYKDVFERTPPIDIWLPLLTDLM